MGEEDVDVVSAEKNYTAMVMSTLDKQRIDNEFCDVTIIYDGKRYFILDPLSKTLYKKET